MLLHLQSNMVVGPRIGHQQYRIGLFCLSFPIKANDTFCQEKYLGNQDNCGIPPNCLYVCIITTTQLY